MVSLCRYFLFALAISLSNCEAKLHEVTEEQLQNFHKAHGHKQRQRAKAAANETLLTAVKKIGDTCYSGTDCDSGQFCGFGGNYYYSSHCKFCDSYDPTISYDVARDREYNICGSRNKNMFYGRCLEAMEKKLTTYGLTGRMMIMMIMITIQVVWASAYILFVGQRIPRIAVNLTQGQSEE